MKIQAYLNFSGDCREAFDFYAKCLGGTIVFQGTWGDSPMADQAPSDFGDKIMHTTLQVGDQVISGADSPPGMYQKPAGISVTIGLNDTAEADRIFGELAEGGTVQLPIQETFWAKRFGMVTDRFGTPWMVNCE